jgi:hypothetical protein
VNAERFELLSQGAQDIRAYDVVKDIQRVERFIGGQPGWSGAVLVLANDPAYWSRPSHGRRTNADAFRIYEGQEITGSRIWGTATGAGTMKSREAALELHGDYRCRWSDYSALPGNRGQFRLVKSRGVGLPRLIAVCADALCGSDRAFGFQPTVRGRCLGHPIRSPETALP